MMLQPLFWAGFALLPGALADYGLKLDKRMTDYKRSYIADPASKETLEPQFFPELNSKRVQLKYGPFPVPPMSESGGMHSWIQGGITMPCTNCTITYMSASLEHPDGSYANANTSLWLHHVVLLNYQVPDTVCGDGFWKVGQRFFASGNERTPADLTLSGKVPTGYYLKSDAIGAMVLELMNQAMHEQIAYPTITFEYIEGFPSNFYKTNPVWLDITGCGFSDASPKTNSTFQYSSPGWNADFSGAVTGLGGHLHDGGTHLEIFQNNKEICNSVAYYGQTPGYIDAPGTSMTMPMNPQFSLMKHISTMTTCGAPVTEISFGDNLWLKAYYNFSEWSPMVDTNGKPSPIMGISLIYAAENMTMSQMTSFVGTKVAPLLQTPKPTEVATMDMSMSDDDDGGEMEDMVMTCVPDRDSPGTISTTGINMGVPRIAMDYLMALLNDSCLQAWSKPYARYFWYAIVAVIGLFTISRFAVWSNLSLRKRNHVGGGSTSVTLATKLAMPFRLACYPQITPKGIPRILKIPNFGNILMISSYFGLLLALEFINASTGDDQTAQFRGVRAGWLSVAQVPLIILLANKRNLVELFTGVSYERLNVLHRWTARGLLLTTSMHFGFQSYGWARAGVMQLEWSSDECPPTGIAAYALVLWMNLSTLAPFRNFSYEFFVLQHIITFMGLIIAIMFHLPDTALYSRTYIYIGIGLYIFSRLVQTVLYAYNNIRPKRAKLSAVSRNVTKVTIGAQPLGSWRPGSFILISLPRFGIFQSHPATIASTSTSHKGDIVLYLRKHEGFTKKISNWSSHTKKHIALIDGAYGGRQSDFAAFHTVVLLAGSTGLTFTLPILLDLAARASTTKLPLARLDFVWATKDKPFIKSMQTEILTALNTLSANGIIVRVHIHATSHFEDHDGMESEKSETTSNDSSSDRGSSVEKSQSIHTHVSQVRTVSSSSVPIAQSAIQGRPNLKEILGTANSQSEDEMGVAVCGPLSMTSEVRNTVTRLQTKNGKGVYLHVEGFSW